MLIPANLPLIDLTVTDFTVTDYLRGCMQRNHRLCHRLLVATARFTRVTRKAINNLQLVATQCCSCQQRRLWRCEPICCEMIFPESCKFAFWPIIGTCLSLTIALMQVGPSRHPFQSSSSLLAVPVGVQRHLHLAQRPRRRFSHSPARLVCNATESTAPGEYAMSTFGSCSEADLKAGVEDAALAPTLQGNCTPVRKRGVEGIMACCCSHTRGGHGRPVGRREGAVARRFAAIERPRYG